MHNIQNIWKKSYKVLIVTFFSFIFINSVSAKTISSSSAFIDSSTRDYFNNVYEREDYKYSILSSEYVLNTSGYGSITYYYQCLTNERPDVSDTKSLDSSCDKLYRFYRNNSVYDIEELSDSKLQVSNAIYYLQDSKHYLTTTYIIILVILVGILLLYLVIKDLFL